MTLPVESNHALAGRCIAVPESRELDVFASLLERRGAEVWRCPLVDIRDAPDPAPVLEWLRMFNGGGCDDLLLFTGEGLRRLLSAIDRHAPEWRERFIERLSEIRIVARGPKPGRVLRELGLRPTLVADPATTAGMIVMLRDLDLRYRRIGVQLYGSDPNTLLMAFLDEAGAQVLPVAPYVYADAADDADVMAMIERMRGGGIDAIAFTSLQQVERLFRVVEAQQQSAALQAALARVVVAAVGPLVVDALAAHGVRVQVIPSESYYLKPLTTALIGALAR
ncbi:uroporphyrinogen-III synthase [Dyella sp. OK004]|uniref:uroporphyrinogen-III synthase n=1 Tax=Dyella sp. OK004 TaxID=1855292 RepID=UPI0008E17E85|nr:uroporphyrinogen-III synthase [Dyella sp. OK004]SFS20043.1 uroporphyrinogen-III synthase [Dyella sp. OK004]